MSITKQSQLFKIPIFMSKPVFPCGKARILHTAFFIGLNTELKRATPPLECLQVCNRSPCLLNSAKEDGIIKAVKLKYSIKNGKFFLFSL